MVLKSPKGSRGGGGLLILKDPIGPKGVIGPGMPYAAPRTYRNSLAQ